jgi:hypothetical protein
MILWTLHVNYLKHPCAEWHGKAMHCIPPLPRRVEWVFAIEIVGFVLSNFTTSTRQTVMSFVVISTINVARAVSRK